MTVLRGILTGVTEKAFYEKLGPEIHELFTVYSGSASAFPLVTRLTA